MTSIQFFYNRDFPGNALRSNARQALDRLGMKPEMRETEAAPEQVGALLPALAIDGEIVVSGVEPSVRELEILFEDHAQEGEEDSACGACGMECGGVNGTEHCPMCGQHGEGGSVAGRIIGFVILLIFCSLRLKYCPESFHAAFVFPPFTAAPRAGIGPACAGAVAALLLGAFFLRRRPFRKWACAAAEFYVAVYGVSSPCRRS